MKRIYVPLRGLLPLIDEPGAVGYPQDLHFETSVVLVIAELLQNLHGAGKGPVIGQTLDFSDAGQGKLLLQEEGLASQTLPTPVPSPS